MAELGLMPKWSNSKSKRESYIGTATIHGLFSNSNQPVIRSLLLWLAWQKCGHATLQPLPTVIHLKNEFSHIKNEFSLSTFCNSEVVFLDLSVLYVRLLFTNC